MSAGPEEQSQHLGAAPSISPSGIQHFCVQRCSTDSYKCISLVMHEFHVNQCCVSVFVCSEHTHSQHLLLCSPADRPGVLVLEVLEVLEECSMRVARCERHRPGGDDSQSEAKARALVLFSRETVAHLMPAPRDIIHIYPPW